MFLNRENNLFTEFFQEKKPVRGQVVGWRNTPRPVPPTKVADVPGVGGAIPFGSNRVFMPTNISPCQISPKEVGFVCLSGRDPREIPTEEPFVRGSHTLKSNENSNQALSRGG